MSTAGHLKYGIFPSNGSKYFQRLDFDPTVDGPAQNWTTDDCKVVIDDARGKEDKYTFDSAGFQFSRHPFKHTRFQDNEEIKAEYYPECAEIIKQLTGATRVTPFNHVIRRRTPDGVNNPPGIGQPSSFAHVDHTIAYAIALAHKLFPDEAPALLRNRFQIVNLWRPISHPAVDRPLVVCDYRSLDVDEDLKEVTLVFNTHESQVLYLKYNPVHRWVYKSAMDPEDFVLFKCVDTVRNSDVATMVPHTSFENPNTPEGTPFRESIELRAFVFYEGN